jgi:hypothetical protein
MKLETQPRRIREAWVRGYRDGEANCRHGGEGAGSLRHHCWLTVHSQNPIERAIEAYASGFLSGWDDQTERAVTRAVSFIEDDREGKEREA